MKKLTTTIVGLSLLVGSAATAQDSFGSFYPAENVDTPSYLIDNSEVKGHNTLAKSSIKSGTLTAFFPAEDVDTPDFLIDNTQGQSVAQSIAKSSVQLCTLASFYPAEDNDSPTAHISC